MVRAARWLMTVHASVVIGVAALESVLHAADSISWPAAALFVFGVGELVLVGRLRGWWELPGALAIPAAAVATLLSIKVVDDLNAPPGSWPRFLPLLIFVLYIPAHVCPRPRLETAADAQTLLTAMLMSACAESLI